jgi:hypothetical protein
MRLADPEGSNVKEKHEYKITTSTDRPIKIKQYR